MTLSVFLCLAKSGVVLRNRGTSRSSLSDDEPLYDSVASDEDYASIGDNQSLKDDPKKEVTKTDQVRIRFYTSYMCVTILTKPDLFETFIGLV